MNKSLLIKTFRLFVVIFTMSVASLGNEISAQTSQKITLKMEDTSLEAVIDAIEKQSRYLFLNDSVDLSTKVSVNVEKQTIGTILSQMFKGLDIEWKISGINIYISKKPVGGGS